MPRGSYDAVSVVDANMVICVILIYAEFVFESLQIEVKFQEFGSLLGRIYFLCFMKTINEMLIQLKNAQRAGHETVEISYSKFKYEIARVLERSGYVAKIERRGKRVKKLLEIGLMNKEVGGVQNVRLISKPSRLLYSAWSDLTRSRQGGIIIVSTPKGVMNSAEAKKAHVGGTLIAEVW